MITGLCEVTLEARDLALLECFYADALGLDVIQRDDELLRASERQSVSKTLPRSYAPTLCALPLLQQITDH